LQQTIEEQGMRITVLVVFFYAITAHAAPVTTQAPLVAEAHLHAGALSGVMLRPETSTASILIIPGSGPTDRDGNNRLGVKGSPYKLLAEGLASKGVTTVRVDKRGMFGSSRAVADANAVTINDYASDVHAWVKVIREQTGVPCVWVAGHSEGGLVALASSQNAEDLCGLILLATPGRPVGQVLREQLRLALGGGPMLQQATATIKALEGGRHPNVYSLDPALQQIFAPPMQGFLISMFSYDPARLIAEFHKPVLILQGERDLQVSVADAKRLKQAAPAAKLVLLPDANHFFKVVKSADMAVNAAAYSKPVPLAPHIADEIADFVSAANNTQ
jgi:pimeloyl-ACP methyl ester carboxylesterase